LLNFSATHTEFR